MYIYTLIHLYIRIQFPDHHFVSFCAGLTVDKEFKIMDFINKLEEGASLCIFASGEVMETKQTFSEQETFTVDKPDLEIKVTHLVYLANLLFNFLDPYIYLKHRNGHPFVHVYRFPSMSTNCNVCL